MQRYSDYKFEVDRVNGLIEVRLGFKLEIAPSLFAQLAMYLKGMAIAKEHIKALKEEGTRSQDMALLTLYTILAGSYDQTEPRLDEIPQTILWLFYHGLPISEVLDKANAMLMVAEYEDD